MLTTAGVTCSSSGARVGTWPSAATGSDAVSGAGAAATRTARARARSPAGAAIHRIIVRPVGCAAASPLIRL